MSLDLEQTRAWAQTRLRSARVMLEGLEPRRSRGFAHDQHLREFLEPYCRWYEALLANIEQEGDNYHVPELPPELQRESAR